MLVSACQEAMETCLLKKEQRVAMDMFLKGNHVFVHDLGWGKVPATVFFQKVLIYVMVKFALVLAVKSYLKNPQFLHLSNPPVFRHSLLATCQATTIKAILHNACLLFCHMIVDMAAEFLWLPSKTIRCITVPRLSFS